MCVYGVFFWGNPLKTQANLKKKNSCEIWSFVVEIYLISAVIIIIISEMNVLLITMGQEVSLVSKYECSFSKPVFLNYILWYNKQLH